MAQTIAIEVLKQWTSAQPSKEVALIATSSGMAALPWQAVTRNSD